MLIPLSQAAKFLIERIFTLYISFVLLRVTFHWAKISTTNHFLITISRLTHPPLKLIYKLIPSVNGMDLAAVLLLSLLSMSKIGSLFWLQTGSLPPTTGLAILAFSEILKQLINIFFSVLIIFAVMSWFNPVTLGPLVEIIVKMSEPLLRPIRWVVPPVSGIDFSPMVAIIALELLDIILVSPLTQIGITFIQPSLISP